MHKFNAQHWRRDYRDFVEWFCRRIASEPHSTKVIEDLVGWALETTPETLIATIDESATPGVADYARAIRCPVLLIHGTADQVQPLENSLALHETIPQSVLVPLQGSGHGPHARDPATVNLLLEEFVGQSPRRERTWSRAMSRRRKRALFVSSPIGLGHVRRDVAIASSLRRLAPDLDVEWLAQPPVTSVLEAMGEHIHPRSCELAGEAAHLESEARDHELHAFQAWRRMDEILVANFMVFLDAVRDAAYDLWIADEGWDIDYYLHENPQLKTAPYVWLTDFVGWLPTQPDEEWLTADYNSEMVEHIARFPRVRDRALFIGNPIDVVPDGFGPGLPLIRPWAEGHYAFPGYVQYFDPRQSAADAGETRARLGISADRVMLVAAVGGTAVGRALLERIIASFEVARRARPELTLVAVGGPRIDPKSLPRADGVDVRGYVPDLYQVLAASDLALVQGGLASTMELVASHRRFLYFPLRHHCEQTLHVPHRLTNYGVRGDARVDYATTSVEQLATLMVTALDRTTDYRAVEQDGAERAARVIADLL
jgi:predicted glycosyltransferase